MGTIYTYESNELYHYGVKGMKWGVRKSRQDRDYDKLARAVKKNTNDYGKLMKSKKKIGDILDDNDNTIGEGVTFDMKLMAKANRSEAKVNKLVKKMEKRYGNISLMAGQTKAGKEYVDIILGNRSGRVEED